MEEEKRKFSPPMVGGSSLLVIFAILCLTVFSLLSLSTVQADGRLDEAVGKTVVGYYEADTKAETILARLRSGDIPEGVEIDEYEDVTYASYECKISDTQKLDVLIEFHGGLGDDYTILIWQSKSTVVWEADDDFNVWDGEGLPF